MYNFTLYQPVRRPAVLGTNEEGPGPNRPASGGTGTSDTGTPRPCGNTEPTGNPGCEANTDVTETHEPATNTGSPDDCTTSHFTNPGEPTSSSSSKRSFSMDHWIIGSRHFVLMMIIILSFYPIYDNYVIITKL